MKNLWVLFVLVVFFFSCGETEKTEGYLINGKITGAADLHLILQKRVSGEFIDIDTAATDPDGNFLFEGKVESPELYYIKVEDKKQLSFFIENSEIVLNAHIDSLDIPAIEGSLVQDKYKKYRDDSKYLRDKSDALYEEYKEIKRYKEINEINKKNEELEKAKQDADESKLAEIEIKCKELEKETDEIKKSVDEEKLADIDKKYEELEADQKAFNIKYAKENGKSVVAAYIAYRNAYNINLEELKDIVNSFDSTLNNTEYVKSLNKRIDILEKTAVGQPAIDFTQNDPEGNPIKLSSFKGKYLLVDFWASWCGPCRKENPNVVKLYEKYKDKGFDILGVSFDKNKDAWLKAIEKDGLVWNQVSDLKYWSNAVGKLYGIRSIPHTMLIDPEGKIVAHKLYGDELDKKLEELMASE